MLKPERVIDDIAVILLSSAYKLDEGTGNNAAAALREISQVIRQYLDVRGNEDDKNGT